MHLSAIHIFPVKGLRGVSVASARVEPWGLEGDRRWMVVDDRGRFISQRECAGLALIGATPEGSGIRLSAPGQADLLLSPPKGGERLTVTVWRSTLSAMAAGPEADAWISAAAGRDCRLVFMDDPAQARPVDTAYGRPEDRVSFADGYPLLVANAASLRDVAAWAVMPGLGMERFRPNLVVEGAEPWVEDGWREMRVGSAVFAAVKPCARCVVTTIDPATGVRDEQDEPLRTLLRFRRDARGQPIFGQNLVPRGGDVVSVGDPVTAG
jgi:uncharacterized protein YcbX